MTTNQVWLGISHPKCHIHSDTRHSLAGAAWDAGQQHQPASRTGRFRPARSFLTRRRGLGRRPAPHAVAFSS